MYLNVQRAALQLGVAPHTVRRWTASGLLPCTRTPGGHRRIRQEDVEALAQQIGGSNHMAARRAREREVDTLLETSLALVSRLELTDLLEEMAKHLTRLMDCHFCAISSYDERLQTVTMLADFDDGGRRLPDTDTYALSRYPATRRVLENRVEAVVNLSDPAADPDELRELTREGDKSLLMVPLVYGGHSIGLLELMDHLRERRYSRQELRICRAIAGQAAVALHNAQTYADARAATRDIEEICAAIDTAGDELAALGTSADLESLLETAARSAGTVFSAASCVVTAAGQSAGFSSGDGIDAAHDPGDRSDGRRLTALKGTDVLTVSEVVGAVELRLTLSLPRPARSGEPQLLGLISTVVGGHLARLLAGGNG
jgi:excisionase family DNA binding protein